MKKLLIGLAALVALLLIAVIVIPFLIPTDAIRDKIAGAVEDATGRKLTIAGQFGISVFPSIQVIAGDVSFANMPGARDSDMVRLRELRIGLRVLPLLAGEVKLDSFVLMDPVINLEVNRDGRANWDFGSAPAPARADRQTTPGTGDARRGGTGPRELSLGEVELVRGRVTYADQRSGQVEEIRDINMRIVLPDLDSRLKADGSLVWNGRKVSLEVASDKPRALIGGASAPVSTKISSDLMNVSFDGTVATAASLRVNGDVAIDVTSVRQLADWAGQPIAMKGTGLGPFKLAGTVTVEGPRYAFAVSQIAVDEIEGEGSVAVDMSQPRVRVNADLRLGQLDLNPYLPLEEEATTGKPGATVKATAKATAGATAGAQPSDWSDEPIDTSGLKAANAKLDLSVAGIQVGKIKVGESAVRLALENSLLRVDLSKLDLYGGGGTGQVVLDGRGKVPSVALTLDIAGVDAAPLLADAAGFDRLGGTGSIRYSVSAKGRTEREMIGNLSGDGAVMFRDGAIKGINLAAMVRNVTTAFAAAGSGEAQKTDFAELSGTFRIANGILRNNDLKLLSPLLRVNGSGTVDLPRRTLDYRIEPKAVASLQGQGGQQDLGGLMVPVVISGPWDRLSYRPDLSGAVKALARNPSKAVEKLKSLKNLGGGITAPSGTTTPDKGGIKVPDAGKLLKGLLGN